MLDTRVRQLIDPTLDRLGSILARQGLGANMVTVLGFLFGAAGCVAIAIQYYGLALALIGLNRIADGLDGAIARRRGTTDVGGYLDIVLDMIFYSGVPFAFAVSRPEFSLPACFLIYSFIGTGGSFLAYAAISAKRGVTTDSLGKKSFYYSAGLIEGTETVIFLVLCCVIPDRFAALAWSFGTLCWVTTAGRIAVGVRNFRNRP